MSSLTAYIDLAPAIGLAAVLVSVIVNAVALFRASRKMSQLRAIAGSLSIEVHALQQKVKGLELAYSDLADAVDSMMERSGAPTHVNGARACDVPSDEDQEMPF